MKKKIYIHCEITKREFEGKLLLSTIAAEKNFDVYLGNITGLESKVNLPSGIFHYTSCVPQKSVIDLFKRLKSKNFFISCQDEEGGVEEIKEFFTKPPKGTFYYRFGQKSLKLVDAIFSWSNFDYENLILRFSKYKKKIFNTGNPRVDMWSKNLTNFYNDKNNSKKFILINSSLIGPTSNKTMLENLEIMKKSFYDNSTFKFERDKIYYFDEFIAYTKFLKVFHNSIIKLAKTFKKQKFIFRPHPTESLELWKFFFRDYKNILVTKEQSSTYWMHKSKILIHCGCYTSIEASNLGLDIITYVPRELKKYAKPFPASLGLYCTSEKNLAKLINNILNSKSKKKYQYQKLKNFNKVNSRFHFPSKKLNAQKIVDVWLNYKDENKTTISFANEIYFQIFIFLKNIKYIFFKKHKINENIYLDRKFLDLNYKKTDLMVHKLVNILKLNSKIKFQLIDNHICRIVKK